MEAHPKNKKTIPIAIVMLYEDNFAKIVHKFQMQCKYPQTSHDIKEKMCLNRIFKPSIKKNPYICCRIFAEAILVIAEI
jgi:ubiquitin-protein ligase